MIRALFLFFSAFSACCCLAADKPQRIVSLSLCSDELVVLLADPDKIASLSYLAADSRYSFFSEELGDIYLNHAQAEELIPLQPDLVLNSQFSATSAVNLLEGFGYPTKTLGFPATLQQAFQQIQEVAALLGEVERGEALIRQMQSRINAVRESLSGLENLSAVFYANNGFSFGSNTLRDDFLTSLGLRNLAAEQGLSGSGKLALERLISGNPDYLLVDQSGRHDAKLIQPLLQHPVLKSYFPAERIIVLPDTLFQCAGPSMIDAYEIILRSIEMNR
tara:strand:- start:1925 stop:2755 length:831 start_codon:yes stop_codon:yes gene_type:complete